MKKTAVVLAAALVLALAAPATFAASIDISGQAETRFEFGQDANTSEWGLTGKTGLKLTPTLRVGDNVELGVEFQSHNDAFDSDDNPTIEFGEGHANPMTPAITKAWLKTTGPYWEGGPAVTTTLGDKTINWNDWVARLGDQRAITVEGIDLVVANADVFYAWAADPADRPMGLRVNSEFAGVEMDGALLRKGNKVNAAVGAATNLDGIHLDGVAAIDSGYRYAFKVNASLNPMDDVTLRAGYRQMQDDFAPMHARMNGTNLVAFHKDSRDAGFDIGVETVQHGFTLGATYDQPTEQASVSAARTFDVVDHAIDTKYVATFTPGSDMKHELSASTMTNAIPYVPGVGFSANVALEGSDVSYDVNSTYTAPNGISLGAGYSSDDGAVVTGGLKVEF